MQAATVPGVRQIPTSLDPSVVAQIDQRLDGVERDDGVRILWAIESGSRAWGFPSPDSDYDCRFLYVRPVDEYLELRRRRDVIETPLDHILDVNGWDLRKALGLLVKGNATVGEWLRSPIVYRGDAAVRDALLTVADHVVDRAGLTRHYVHVARNNLELLDRSGQLKKFLYALRPALILRWLRVHDGATVPPMDVVTLLTESEVTDRAARDVRDLVDLKSATRELGAAAVPSELRQFVDAELSRADQATAGQSRSASERAAAWHRAESTFIELVRR
jgi:predicted nucleotidyltransferase